MLLTCTRLHQPVRRICAIPRASLRSVLLRTPASVFFTWRDSMRASSLNALEVPVLGHLHQSQRDHLGCGEGELGRFPRERSAVAYKRHGPRRA